MPAVLDARDVEHLAGVEIFSCIFNREGVVAIEGHDEIVALLDETASIDRDARYHARVLIDVDGDPIGIVIVDDVLAARVVVIDRRAVDRAGVELIIAQTAVDIHIAVGGVDDVVLLIAENGDVGRVDLAEINIASGRVIIIVVVEIDRQARTDLRLVADHDARPVRVVAQAARQSIAVSHFNAVGAAEGDPIARDIFQRQSVFVVELEDHIFAVLDEHALANVGIGDVNAIAVGKIINDVLAALGAVDERITAVAAVELIIAVAADERRAALARPQHIGFTVRAVQFERALVSGSVDLVELGDVSGEQRIVDGDRIGFERRAFADGQCGLVGVERYAIGQFDAVIENRPIVGVDEMNDARGLIDGEFAFADRQHDALAVVLENFRVGGVDREIIGDADEHDLILRTVVAIDDIVDAVGIVDEHVGARTAMKFIGGALAVALIRTAVERRAVSSRDDHIGLPVADQFDGAACI